MGIFNTSALAFCGLAFGASCFYTGRTYEMGRRGISVWVGPLIGVFAILLAFAGALP